MNTCTRTGADSGVEWVGTDVCDGVHPETGQCCVLGEHRGYHRAEDGSEWLDDD